MIRGYDTPSLYRKDTILRIRALEYEIREIRESIARQERELLGDPGSDSDRE